jgi:hypothetical protein
MAVVRQRDGSFRVSKRWRGSREVELGPPSPKFVTSRRQQRRLWSSFTVDQSLARASKSSISTRRLLSPHLPRKFLTSRLPLRRRTTTALTRLQPTPPHHTLPVVLSSIHASATPHRTQRTTATASRMSCGMGNAN